MLYDFQKDAVLGIINKLERHNGCILADSVGLGKTFSALGVIKYYQERNKSVLVLCPKKLGDNWQTFLHNYEDNPLYKDRFNYDVLYHTDLSREKGFSNDKDLSRVNWGNYDLVVIDESHNFRNNNPRKDKETRYQRLLNRVMKAGVKTKVLMLSATPVNNKFTDLKNQIALAYEGETDQVDEKMDISKSINSILNKAQRTFNDWAKRPEEEKNSKDLLNELGQNFDFFKLLDNITISRSRNHITNYYDMEKIGKFPKRLKPKSVRSKITTLLNFMKVEELYNDLSMLNMSIYSPFDFILKNKIAFYSELYDTKVNGHGSLKQTTREKSLQKLMKINLLKRLESSVDSFRITVSRFLGNIANTIESIENFENNISSLEPSVKVKSEIESYQYNDDFAGDGSEDWLSKDFSIGDKIKINLADMNTSGWKAELENDKDIAENILKEMEKVVPEKDAKLEDLKKIIKDKIKNPINKGNKKILIFTAFADTAHYLYENLSVFNKELNLETAKITGGGGNKTTLSIDSEFNNILLHFSPRSKKRQQKHEKNGEIDILIATDCISEGQNLQDCDFLVNYDIHWNPVRIIQRFGRVDRIGSINDQIQLLNFWPQLSLDEYINLKNRVEGRMLLVDMTATGEDNVLTNESSELEYRKKQLQKLQEEVVDLEDMDSGISITDLGLNDFRMDLVNYVQKNGSLADIPNGMHSVCKSDSANGIESGVIFVLKNRNNSVNIDNTNRLHPFYLLYIKENGEVFSHHLEVKKTLDLLRSLAKGQKEPIQEAYISFNKKTKDGNNMQKYSDLLSCSIESILQVKEDSEIDSLFSSGGTTALVDTIKGLEDFELISFLVIE